MEDDHASTNEQHARRTDQLQIPMALTLKPARRLRLVEVAVDVDLQQCCRVIARAPGLFGNDAVEAEPREVEHIDDGVDHPNRVLLSDVILDRVRQQRRLSPIRALDEPPIRPSRKASPGIVQCFAGIAGFSHDLIQKLPKTTGPPRV
jgi:hypothetical protein